MTKIIDAQTAELPTKAAKPGLPVTNTGVRAGKAGGKGG